MKRTNTQFSESINNIKIGVWKLSGIDEEQTVWRADLIIQTIRNNTCIGYFDWYSGVNEFYRGREYFEGTYLEARRRIELRGTRLENVQLYQIYQRRGLILGVYQASLSNDGLTLYDGYWGDQKEVVVPGTWRAEWVKHQYDSGL